MKTLNYLDLVVATVKGQSPVLEYQNVEFDRHKLAVDYLEKLRKSYSNSENNPQMIDVVLMSGPDFLVEAWKFMSPNALTMSGDANIDCLLEALRTIEAENIPGDYIETGVWRGGLPIIMRAFLQHHQIKNRRVFLADSFQGLPDKLTDPMGKAAHILLEPLEHLSASRKTVEEAFDFFGLNDEQVIFLEGWFEDTLKDVPSDSFSLIRLDGDYYESTQDAIRYLYPKLSVGGYIIVDDYNLPVGCPRAIDEYRAEHQITTEMIEINHQSVYWRKEPFTL